MHPVSRKCTQGPDLQGCGDLLQRVYRSDTTRHEAPPPYATRNLESIRRFTAEEIIDAVSHMKKNKAADRQGIVLEMFAHGGANVVQMTERFLNNILDTGDSWYESFFAMLPKTGDLTDVNNWRPIALLSISYKILARILHTRLKGQLEQQQSEDQYGFRPKRSTAQALLVFESLVGKGIEWNVPVWIISIDLRKAFDRVERSVLFRSLREQGVDDSYICLLQMLYERQKGVLSENVEFNIDRGVRQGDILSPMLFNAALEQAIRRWKQRLTRHGFSLVPDDEAERLTNIRFADDILLIGKSLQESIDMMELLVDILSEFGLELNVKKTIIFTSNDAPQKTTLVETKHGFVEILGTKGVHKYLGRCFPGELRNRGQSALDYRLQCGWGRFKSLQETLTDKKVDVRLRLQLFDVVVTPSVMYGLETCPLTMSQLQRLDTTQRCMLRRIVGWVGFDNESWEERGRRMKKRLMTALELRPVMDWSKRLKKKKEKMICSLDFAPHWTKLAYQWQPLTCSILNEHHARRPRGRPRTRCE